jgi:hypothetical protein
MDWEPWRIGHFTRLASRSTQCRGFSTKSLTYSHLTTFLSMRHISHSFRFESTGTAKIEGEQ